MSVIAVMCFVFLAPAFADMKNVDEAELAKTNASVTGASEKDQIFDAEKNVVNPETLKVRETINKDANISPSVNNTITPTSLDMNVNGQTTFMFGFGGATSNVTSGVINSCKMH